MTAQKLQRELMKYPNMQTDYVPFKSPVTNYTEILTRFNSFSRDDIYKFLTADSIT